LRRLRVSSVQPERYPVVNNNNKPPNTVNRLHGVPCLDCVSITRRGACFMHSGIRGQWRVCAAAVLGGWICCTATALAQSSGDSGTAVVIPGRPDVPVIVNAFGFDASYTVG